MLVSQARARVWQAHAVRPQMTALVRRGLLVSGRRPEQVLRGQLYLTMRPMALAVVSVSNSARAWSAGARTLETMHTMKPFSSMLYDSTVFASWRILPVAQY
jgi:hypothetical protein